MHNPQISKTGQDSKSAVTDAWLLEVSPQVRVAVGIREVLQLLDWQDAHPVPLTPGCCQQVVFWREKILPVMDLSLRLGGSATGCNLLALVAYQDIVRQSAGLGTLMLAAPPRRISVADTQACPCPENLKELALAAFEFEKNVIPILDLAKVFAINPAGRDSLKKIVKISNVALAQYAISN